MAARLIVEHGPGLLSHRHVLLVHEPAHHGARRLAQVPLVVLGEGAVRPARGEVKPVGVEGGHAVHLGACAPKVGTGDVAMLRGLLLLMQLAEDVAVNREEAVRRCVTSRQYLWVSAGMSLGVGVGAVGAVAWVAPWVKSTKASLLAHL